MKIEILKRNEIEDNKWNEVIRTDEKARIFALTWYLDAVTGGNWMGMVGDDYAAVMPLHTKSKLFFPYITQAFLCQQVGVFVTNPINRNRITQLFFDSIPFYFIKFNMQVHTIPLILSKKYQVSLRTNHILPLDRKYAEIQKNYNRNTVRNIRKADEFLIDIHHHKADLFFIEFLKTNDPTGLVKSHSQIITTLFKNAEMFASAFYQTASDESGIIGVAYYIVDQKSVYFLLCTVNEVGKDKKVMFKMIDQTIQNFSEKNLVFDFTGSSIVSIAQRNLGFGAVEEQYYSISRSII